MDDGMIKWVNLGGERLLTVIHSKFYHSIIQNSIIQNSIIQKYTVYD